MLLRFVVKNIYSFKDETEFNLFPSSNETLNHHKSNFDNIEFLKFSAIYGANGSGKSNLIKAITLLQTIVLSNKIPNNLDKIKFKLNDESLNQPITFEIDFISHETHFYYKLVLEENIILYETLQEITENKENVIFERKKVDGELSLKLWEINDEHNPNDNLQFISVLKNGFLKDDESLLFLLQDRLTDFPQIQNAYFWFKNSLEILRPEAELINLAHFFEVSQNILNYANESIKSINLGIEKLEVKKQEITEFLIEEPEFNIPELLNKLQSELNNESKKVSSIRKGQTGETLTFEKNDKSMFVKRLTTRHLNYKNEEVEFNFGEESDGTKKIIHLIPAFYKIIKEEKVYFIDEIERSIHPLLMKKIIQNLVNIKNVKGQLIFTTHESNLLDLKLLRPDEIWFAEKDTDGASGIYPLSDYKIKDDDIENGYLNGRFGGIPFLGHLKNLKYEL